MSRIFFAPMHSSVIRINEMGFYKWVAVHARQHVSRRHTTHNGSCSRALHTLIEPASPPSPVAKGCARAILFWITRHDASSPFIHHHITLISCVLRYTGKQKISHTIASLTLDVRLADNYRCHFGALRPVQSAPHSFDMWPFPAATRTVCRWRNIYTFNFVQFAALYVGRILP